MTATVTQLRALQAERFDGRAAAFGPAWRCEVWPCDDMAVVLICSGGLGGERRRACEEHAGVVLLSLAGGQGEARLTVRRLS